MTNTVQIETFGCRLNTYESEVMRNLAKQANLDDAIIINTCSVTKEAERQARQSIRKLGRQNPGKRIIVTGCAAQTNPDQFASMDEVHQVMGNEEKLKLDSYLNTEQKMMVNDIMSVKETASHLIAGFEGRARAFIQVQNGCDHRCTYCSIPFGRGNNRSNPIGEIVTQTKLLVEQGYKEIVLTGVDITAYGEDLPGQPRLGQMCKRLLALVPDLPRLRLSSLDPVEIDDDLWWLIEHEPRLMPHLHLSLQAGNDMILKRMKRRHNRQDVIDFCTRARSLRPDIVFGADLIAGFPTETDEMFEDGYRLIEECAISLLHVFPYSARENTPAARMPQVPGNIRKERAAKLRELGKKLFEAELEKIKDREVNVLVEKPLEGKTEHYLPVTFDKEQVVGSIVAKQYFKEVS